MDLGFVLKLVNFIVKEFGKELQPIANNVEFSDQLHYAQLKYFKNKIGLPEKYAPGMPLPSQAFEITKRITEDLRPFKVLMGYNDSTPLSFDERGFADYPKDYYYPSVMTHVITGIKRYEREVEFLSDSEYTKRTTSFSEKPDKYFPVVNLQSDKIRIFPKGIRIVNFIYLRFPKKPFLAVSSTRGFEEYDSENSTELEWNDVGVIDIISIFLGNIGISIQSGELLNYSEKLKVQGD